MTYLLIDTSYSIFYRFYATKRWYQCAHSDDTFPDDYNWFNNELFRPMFIKNYYKSFSKIIKKYNIEEKNIIFIRDCSRKDIWRMDYYKPYKSTRKDTSNIKPFFTYTYDTIISDLVEKKGCKVIQHPHLEADDIICLCKKYIRNAYPDTSIIIISSDCDLIQLIDPKTSIINLQHKLLNDKCKDMSPSQYVDIKIICGDTSDNIEGCFNKCGEKTALKLIHNKQLLKEKIRKNPGSLYTYALNTILIHFDNIPTHLVDSCNSLIQTIL